MMPRHYFAGANTPHGFCDFFDNIIPLERTKKKIYIKGGSGSGKSTLMKNTAALFEGKGCDVEYFHCSNDALGLDGICALQEGYAVVDATSPHPTDPQMPGAVDEMFDTAQFLDKIYIQENKFELLELAGEKKNLYKRAYGYLKAASEIENLNNAIYQNALDERALNNFIVKFLKNLTKSFTPANNKKIINRELFATAITPEGLKSLIDSALEADRMYVLEGVGVMGIYELLFLLQKRANLSGIETISFKNPLESSKIEHLLFPELCISFITSNKYHKVNAEAYEKINFEEFLKPSKLAEEQEEIDYNNKLFDELLQKSMQIMAASKEAHSKIEEIYIRGMDFNKMNQVYNNVLEGFI